MSHAGNVTFNSFAAEVEFHADWIVNPFTDLVLKKHAVRADMSIKAGEYEGTVGKLYYHDLDSNIVKNQSIVHGDR